MRLPLLAAVAFAAAVEAAPTGPKTCANDGECGDDEFCRVSVAASGGACEAAVQTCAKLSVRGEQCGGGGGAAQDCFRNRCKSPLRCRENGVDAELPGTCAKECDIGGGVTVLEGWTGPVEGAGKWCHTSYCDGSDETAAGGVLKTSGGDAGAACPTGLADGLRCCVGAGESGQVCCGTSGAWVTPDGKARCGKVLAKGDSTGAPFSVTCTGVCARTGAAAVDDGWRGPSAEDGEWCNTCVCARGKLACTERVCPPSPPTCSSYTCFLDFNPYTFLTPLADKPGKDDIVCSATGCTAHRCCDWTNGLLLSPDGGTVDYPAVRPPTPFMGTDLWVLNCEGRVPQMTFDSLVPGFDGIVVLDKFDPPAPMSRLANTASAATDVDYSGGAFFLLIVRPGTFSLRYTCIDP